MTWKKTLDYPEQKSCPLFFWNLLSHKEKKWDCNERVDCGILLCYWETYRDEVLLSLIHMVYKFNLELNY